MSKYESEVKKLNASADEVFRLLSRPSNLEQMIRDRADDDKKMQSYMKDIYFDDDSIRGKSHEVGEVVLRIIEREPYKTIKFETENAPVSANVWIQLIEVSELDTRMKVTLKADIPTMVKMMLDGKLKKGVNKIAEMAEKLINGSIGKS